MKPALLMGLLIAFLALVPGYANQAAAEKSIQPVYHIPLRVHLQNSSRPPREFLAIFEEINRIWQSQAGICFQIEGVSHDRPLEEGLDMWFSPDLGVYNGYYDGEYIQMCDYPELRPAPRPAIHAAARTAAHELGHALGLSHRQASDDNLMRSKTYGWQLSDDEVSAARLSADELAIERQEVDTCSPPRFGPDLPF